MAMYKKIYGVTTMLEQLKEDIEQYNFLKDNFEALSSEDGKTAYELAIQMLVAADRWVEICKNISNYAKEMNTTRTALYDWSYHKYRILMNMHEFCRVVYRQCEEEQRNSFRGEM